MAHVAGLSQPAPVKPKVPILDEILDFSSKALIKNSIAKKKEIRSKIGEIFWQSSSSIICPKKEKKI